MDQQDYMAVEEEERQERRDHLRCSRDERFHGHDPGAVVILIMILLILSLVNWLRRDIMATFTLLGSRFQQP